MEQVFKYFFGNSLSIMDAFWGVMTAMAAYDKNWFAVAVFGCVLCFQAWAGAAIIRRMKPQPNTKQEV